MTFWLTVLLLMLVLLVLAVGYTFGASYFGFGPRIGKITEALEYDASTGNPTKRTVTQERESERTLWDWMPILIPASVAAMSALFVASQQNLRAQDALVQGYLDAMGTVLLEPQQRDNTEDVVSALATGRTLTVLDGLDEERRGRVMEFLQRAHLINKEHPIVHLSGANLSDAILSDDDFSGADLSGANLSGANLSGADLSGADLSDAALSDTNLANADLREAELEGAKGVTDEQLDQAASLKGAIMPDGSKNF